MNIGGDVILDTLVDGELRAVPLPEDGAINRLLVQANVLARQTMYIARNREAFEAWLLEDPSEREELIRILSLTK